MKQLSKSSRALLVAGVRRPAMRAVRRLAVPVARPLHTQQNQTDRVRFTLLVKNNCPKSCSPWK